MEKETVLGVIKKLSLGNSNMEKTLDIVYEKGKPVIDRWPEDKTALLSRKLLHATSCLIHRNIRVDEFALLGSEYWESEYGKRVDMALASFVEARVRVIEAKRK